MGSNKFYVNRLNHNILTEQTSVVRFLDKEIHFQEYKEALVSLDSYGCFINGEFLQNTAFYENFNTVKNTPKENYKNVLSNCIYIGCFASTWGHWLTDTLKKIWFLKTYECKKKISQGWKIIFISLNDGGNLFVNHKMSTNQKELLKLADIDVDSWLEVKENTIVHNLVIPDNSLIHTPNKGMYFTKEFKETIHNITISIPEIKGYEKVYFTRTSLNSTKDFGERQVERLFAKKGYKIIEPEKISVLEQISILKSCVFFAACESSTSHNSIFCKPGTNVIILRKADYVNEYTLVINQIADLNAIFIDAHHSVFANKKIPAFGPFFMYVTSFLKEWAGIKQKNIPYWLSITWFKYVFYGKHNKFFKQTDFYLCIRYPRYFFGKIKLLLGL